LYKTNLFLKEAAVVLIYARNLIKDVPKGFASFKEYQERAQTVNGMVDK